MNRVWKWILLGLGVFILAFCVALPLFLGFGARLLSFSRMPMMGQPYSRFPMMGHGSGIIGGFGPLRLLFPLVALVIVVLVIVGIVLLLRRPQKPAAVAIAPAVTPLDATSSEPIPPSAVAPAEVVQTTPCPHCGAPVQSGWVACPHCGERLT